MILNDKDIRERKIIEPFSESQLTPNGYDVSVIDIHVIVEGISVSSKGFPPKARTIVLTKEKLTIPNNVVGIIKMKTKWARRGLIISDGAIDAGFIGQLNLCIWNLGEEYIPMSDGTPIVQVLFFETNPVEKEYGERSGNYQNLSKVEVI